MSDHQHGANAGRSAALIEAWLDRRIDAEELAELEGLLLESAAVRAEFWERGMLHGLLYEASKTEFGALETSPLPPPPSSARAVMPRWFSLVTSLALLLAGCLLGGLAVSQAGLPTARRVGLVLHRESFEAGAPAVAFLPKTLDAWGGDATAVVGPHLGVAPHEGNKMLRFVGPSPLGSDHPLTKASEIWRFIDLESARDLVAAEAIRVELTAFFNDVHGADAAARCGITLMATDADPRDLSGEQWLEQLTLAELRPEAMAIAEVREAFDSQRSTWQPVSAAISVPSQARYLIVHCWAEIRRPEEPAIDEFSHGRFVDDISIEVLPNEPEWR
jgi:hypothetical protein